jgi:hypothetical protein
MSLFDRIDSAQAAAEQIPGATPRLSAETSIATSNRFGDSTFENLSHMHCSFTIFEQTRL